MIKKILSILCAVALTAGICTGCGKTNEANVDGKKITLRFSFWEPSTGKEMKNSLQKIVDEYEKANENVHIELVSQAANGYQDWIKSQLAVDDLPEIEFNYCPTIIDQYQAGKIENIKEYLDGKTQYNGKKIWKETFIDGRMDAAHEYRVEPEFIIPLYQTGIAMFYNKTVYDELGLKAPTNWNEFMSNCDYIQKNTDKMPIAFMAQKDDALKWLRWELVGGLCLERWLADKGINDNGDNYLSQNEIAKGIDSKAIDFANDTVLQDEYKQFIEYVKQYCKYSPDASGLDEAAAKTLFLSGQAVHLNSGSWDIVGLLKNDEVEFEPAVFPYPHLTQENSQYAGKGISNNCVVGVAITSSVEKQEGAKEAAVDFLQYLTAPKQYEQFVIETCQIPSVKDVNVDPMFEAFIENGYPLADLFRLGDSAAGRTLADIYTAVIAGDDVKLNQATFEEAQKTIEAANKKTMEAKKWNKENNFEIDSLPIVGGTFGK